MKASVLEMLSNINERLVSFVLFVSSLQIALPAKSGSSKKGMFVKPDFRVEGVNMTNPGLPIQPCS